jgi:hypothetical protein
MAERHLREMGLDPEQVNATVRFLRAYAATAMQELQAAADAEPGDVRRDPAFTIAADAATAFREAGQWMLYLDTDLARQLLTQAGSLFLRIGQPFGAYLVEVAGTGRQAIDYTGMLREMTAVQGEQDDAEMRWPSLRHPQQQAYLMLASTAAEDPSPLTRRVMERSSYARGVVPVGALGTPIRTIWDIARHLLAGGADAPRVIAGHLVGMARRYGETMALAQVNQHLWRNGAAPVDVGDIDIAGVAALSGRRLGTDAMLGILREADLDPIDMAPIEAGLALAEPGLGQR